MSFLLKKLAHNNTNVIGYICQNKIDNDYYLHFTPGVSINNKSDNNKQKYNHPEILKEKGIDYFIIGRSLYNSNNIEEEIKKYLIY